MRVFASVCVALACVEGAVAGFVGSLGPHPKLSHLSFGHGNGHSGHHGKPSTKPPAGKKHEYLTAKTKKFWVDGNKIPDVDFDVGESYAGLLPISKRPGETRKLYFWFFPTTGAVKDDLTIWLNGGPGLEGFLQENGPISWQWGRVKPDFNKYTWTNLTNMLWVEQPVGTGYSQGVPTATNEEDVAEQFSGFLQNFIETFGLYNKKLYVTGESYAGAYVPYITNNLYEKKNKTLFDPRGLMIYNPTITDLNTHVNVPALRYMEQNKLLFPIDDKDYKSIKALDAKCGYSKFIEQNLVFPPKGKMKQLAECNTWDAIFEAVTKKNACFNAYLISTTCPLLHDPLGFPGSFPYITPGTEVYFNRTDVKKAINAPTNGEWELCSGPVFVNDVDLSDPSGWKVLPKVIEKNERTVIGSGLFDFVIPDEGTLLGIQNMTWAGKQGFQKKPSKEFIIPYEGQGRLGVSHTERKLTYIRVELAGHMVPQFQPGAAYLQLEYLLGRRKDI